MELYVGIDVSLEEAAICLVDENGRVVRAGKVASDPATIATFLRERSVVIVRIVLESGQLSTWLTRELQKLGLPAVCVDARQANRALSGRLNKSDPADAEGLAQLARTGWFREVHVKSEASDRLRAHLGARDRLIRIRKDLESQIRGTLKTFGIKLGAIKSGIERQGFRVHVRQVIAGDPTLETAMNALLAAHQTVCQEYERLDRIFRRSARQQELVARMMTVPGVGEATT